MSFFAPASLHSPKFVLFCIRLIENIDIYWYNIEKINIFVQKQKIHTMGKRLLAVFASLLAIVSASAQERGKCGLGPKLGIYTNTGGATVYGIGAEMKYNISDPLRIVPSVMWLSNDDCSMEIALDWQYMCRVAPHWHVYPLAGLSANDIRGWTLGIDLGLGTDYAVGKHLDVSGGLKWMVECNDDRNPIAVFLGMTFKF